MMKFNKTVMNVVDTISDLVQESIGEDLETFRKENIGVITSTLQTVYDFDLEVLVHTTLFTMWKIVPVELEKVVTDWRDYIFETLINCEGDVEGYLTSDEEEEDETSQVDPDTVQHLNTCFSL